MRGLKQEFLLSLFHRALLFNLLIDQRMHNIIKLY
jgi:hypothetical protein